MKLNSLLQVALALSLSVTLSGCPSISTSQRLQAEAAARIGAATAGVSLQRQPAECGQGFDVLGYRPGEEAVTTIERYEDLIEGPVNGRIARCYTFNENQIAGMGAR